MISSILSTLVILGTWQYAGFRYNDVFYPNPNPELVLLVSFYEDSTSHMIWFRKDEPGFCERRGIYSLKGDYLWQKITWVNPENASSCGRDPDMILGHESMTQIFMQNEELAFVLDLDGRPFYYILRHPVQSVSRQNRG